MSTKEVEPTIYRIDQASIGRMYEAEYVGDLAEQALNKLQSWLKANEAPGEVWSLIDNVVYLTMIEQQIRADDLSDLDAAELPVLIPSTIKKIAALDAVGGDPVEWLKNAKVALDPDLGEKNGPSIFGGKKARTQNSK